MSDERTPFLVRSGVAVSALCLASVGALLLFAPESHYWLTGYDTFGYCFFQCLVFTREGAFTLLYQPILPIETPLKATGGLAILHGSLAPEGCVVKLAGHERKH